MSTLTRFKAALWRGTRSHSVHHAVLLLFIATLLIALVPIARAGTTRYVATTGADAGDCSNSAAPCRTIGYVIGQAAAGDTINIAAGTYNESIGITLIGSER